MSNSTRPRRGRKQATGPLTPPKKPYDDFPLTPHATGKWQKKIRGKTHYFGAWKRRENGKYVREPGDGWKEAKAEYDKVADDLHAGRTPQESGEGTRVKDLCNKFLKSKLLLLQSGEIGPRTFAEYRGTTDRIVECFGRERLVDQLRDEDFEQLRADLAARFGVVRLGNEIVRVKGVFKHGKKRDLVPESFRKPSARMLRKNRHEGGKRLFTAEEIRTLLDGKTVPGKGKKQKVLRGAGPQLRAMILLGINCGFGNADVGDLPLSAVDLKTGWIDFPRPKTGIERRCPLWPETVASLRAAKSERTKPQRKADRDCVFITQQGRRWVRVHVKDETISADVDAPSIAVQVDAVGQEFRKLLVRFHINGRRGLGFYSLRHTFRTVADATKDQPAVRLIMGHSDASIDNIYRESIDDGRLVVVTEHVRAWLFGGEGGAK